VSARAQAAAFVAGAVTATAVGALALPPRSADRYRTLDTFAQTLAYVANNYVDQTDERRLLHGAARGLVGTVFSVANGSAFWRKSSYLVGREGTAIASPMVTIVDDPLLPRAPGSRPFDGDGLPTRRNVLVDQGVLRTVLCDVYSARKLGRPSTGSAGRGIGGNPGPTTSNLVLQAGTMSRDELLRSTGRGLYVTSMMGFGFNAVTGDFSRGAQGFWIENGELTFPVSEITISANFDDILRRIDGVADDLVLRTSTASPTLRVSHMMVAGSSK